MALKTQFTIDGVPISSLSDGSEKKVILVCNDCGTETVAIFSNYVNSQRRYHRNGDTYCRNCSNKRTGLLKRGKPLPAACGPRPATRKTGSANYGGGRWIASDGYVMILVGTRQYEREHVLVMEKSIGRTIDKDSGELIHHIDMDKTNNLLENLALLPNEKAHKEAHKSLETVAVKLVRSGLVKYCRKTNQYMAVGKLRELLERPEEVNQQPSRDGNAPKGSTTRGQVPLGR